eukprot:bmy_03854T0
MSASLVRATVRAVSKRKLQPTRAALTLTPSAVNKIKQLLKDKPEHVGVKVGVRTRGCNGLSYTLEYTKTKGDSDEEVVQDGVRVFIEKKAQLTLLGTEMDYVEGKLSNFTICLVTSFLCKKIISVKSYDFSKISEFLTPTFDYFLIITISVVCEAKLLAMQQARETAVQQYKKLEEEIQTLRVYYSLHKSLSQEENLKDQFNHTLSTYEEALKNRENIVSITQQQNDELATQLQQALTDRANMELELQHTIEASRAANDKVQKNVSHIMELNNCGSSHPMEIDQVFNYILSRKSTTV